MIRCVYQYRASAAEASRIARAIAIEQTVEVPEALITPEIENGFVGRVLDISEHEPGVQRATIEYQDRLAAGQIPQLINLLLGNTSIDDRVRLIDLQLPDSVLSCFPGPNFGISGLREMLGIHGRPLVCSVLKPRGSTIDVFSNLARDFALGGGDVIKDDHNLVCAEFDQYAKRVQTVQQVIDEANAASGSATLYFPWLCAPTEQIPRHIEFALEQDVRGFLVAPSLLGLDQVRSLATQYSVFLMAHPSMTGVYYAHPDHGIDMPIWMGTLMRLAGLDASIVTQAGGRFNLTRESCARTAERLREPLGDLQPAWPVPAGGLRFDMLDDAFEDYGADTILLIGGDLLARPEGLQNATRALIDRITQRFPAHAPTSTTR